jgi:hypothetical protein
MSRVLPRQPAPELVVPTLSGTTWNLAAAAPQRFSLIVFYRGLHCPICKTYIASRRSTSSLPRIIRRVARRDRGKLALPTPGITVDGIRRV